jgi:hypothetical protein
VDLNHRPRPYQGTTVRFHNDLQDLQEPRGLPKYLQVAQDNANCGFNCGLKSSAFGKRVCSRACLSEHLLCERKTNLLKLAGTDPNR